ncbi:MAG TPA: hypothetical protein PKI19_02940 [Elusimicrobiales bacterium]|nr:hypothetical protein [Elusimicrobiales bacterium]
MENSGLNKIVALALACAFACAPAAASSGEYKALSARIVKCAAANAVVKIAVLEFSAKDGVGRSETEYVAGRIGLALAGNTSLALIEREQLDKVLQEARLSSAAGAADGAGLPRDIFSVDAVVTGTVYDGGEFLKVLTKLIDLKTGRVLLAVETAARRREKDLLKSMFGPLEPPAALPAGPEEAGPAQPAFAGGLRDAVAETEPGGCADRRLRLARLNFELVEMKAWYWATKMREPELKAGKFKINPGSEIADAAVRARFVSLLAGYAGSAAAQPPEPEKLAGVLELLKLEKRVGLECGLI